MLKNSITNESLFISVNGLIRSLGVLSQLRSEFLFFLRLAVARLVRDPADVIDVSYYTKMAFKWLSMSSNYLMTKRKLQPEKKLFERIL